MPGCPGCLGAPNSSWILGCLGVWVPPSWSTAAAIRGRSYVHNNLPRQVSNGKRPPARRCVAISHLAGKLDVWSPLIAALGTRHRKAAPRFRRSCSREQDGSQALSMKSARFWSGRMENPLENEDRYAGRRPWITKSAGEPTRQIDKRSHQLLATRTPSAAFQTIESAAGSGLSRILDDPGPQAGPRKQRHALREGAEGGQKDTHCAPALFPVGEDLYSRNPFID